MCSVSFKFLRGGGGGQFVKVGCGFRLREVRWVSISFTKKMLSGAKAKAHYIYIYFFFTGEDINLTNSTID